MLFAISKDIEAGQSAAERFAKLTQIELGTGMPETAASAHGALRHVAGFDLSQLVGEFRAMRASVLALSRLLATTKNRRPRVPFGRRVGGLLPGPVYQTQGCWC